MPRISRRAKRLILANTVAGLVVSLAIPSLASTNIFNGGTPSWNVLSNWSLGHVPNSTDALFLNSPTTTNSQLDNDYTAQTQSFDTGSANFNIDANSSGTTTRTLTLTGGTNANGGSDLISLSANTTGTITLGGTAGVGTLTVAFGSATGTINVANAAAKIAFGSASIITGSNGLTKSGAGTLTLAGTNSYTGTTTVSGGTLSVSAPLQSTAYALTGGTFKLLASNVLPATSAVTLTGGTLDIGSFNNTVGSVSLQSGSITGTTGVITSTSTYDVQSGTISAILAGSAVSIGLTKSTSGTATLSGANTYTGTTSITGGILRVSKLTANGTASNIGAGTAFTLNGGTLQYVGTGDSTDRTIRLGLNAGTLDASGSGEIDFNGNILLVGASARTLTLTGTGSGGLGGTLSDQGTPPSSNPTSLIKNGTGTWWLAGNNTYTGATTINAGTVNALFLNDGGAASSLGASSNIAANLVLGDGVTLLGEGATDRLFTLIGSATIKGTSWNFTNTGAIALGGTNTARTLTLIGGGVLTGFAPTLGDNGTGATSLIVTGGGTCELTGPQSYSGDTTIDHVAGFQVTTLNVMGANFLSPASHINIPNGDTLDLGSFNNTVNGLTMTFGLITGTGVLTSSSDFNLAYGSVYVGLSGTGGLIKTTSAMVGLYGTCTYTGNTEIDAGQLLVLGALPGNSTVNIFAGAVLDFSRSNTVTQGVDFGTLTGAGIFRQSGSGTLIINRANPFTGTVRVSSKVVLTGSLNGTAAVNVESVGTLSGSGTITLANGGAVTVQTSGTLAPDSGTSSGLTINAASGAASLNLQGGSTMQLAITNSLGGSHGTPSLNDYSKLTLGTNVTATLSGLIATTVTGTVNNGDVYVIVFSNTAVSGMFSNTGTAANGSAGSTYLFTSGGQQWEINYAWTGSTPLNGMDFTNFAQVTGGTNVALLAIPEPGSLLSLLGSGALLLGRRRRHCSRAH